MKAKKVLVTMTVLFILLTAAVWAGGRQDSATVSDTGPLQVRGSIEVWYQADTFLEQFQAVRTTVERNKANVQVRLEVIPYADMATRMMTACLANAGPDVMHQSVTVTNGFMMQGLLEPIQNYFARDGRNLMTEFNPDIFSIVREGDNIYAVPNNASVMALVYNKDLFVQAGLTRAPETWAELYEWAERLTKRNPDGSVVYGIGWPGRNAGNIWFRLLPNIWSAGGDIVDAQMRNATLNTPAVKEALAFYTDVLQRGIAPRSLLELENSGIQPMFQSGNVAMAIENMTFPKELHDRGIVDVGVGLWPGKYGPLDAGIGGWFLCIASSARNKEGGAYFISQLTNLEGQSLSPPFPGLLAALDDPIYSDPFFDPFKEALRSRSRQFPQFENSPRAQAVIMNMVQSVMAGVRTIDEAVDEANLEIQELLDIQNSR